jgi:hypothetical protein
LSRSGHAGKKVRYIRVFVLQIYGKTEETVGMAGLEEHSDWIDVELLNDWRGISP